MAKRPKHTEYIRSRYQNDPEYRKRHKAIKDKRKAELKAWFVELKSNMKCSKCEESHPACIQFHHKDASKKEGNVSDLIKNGWSRENILKEIGKCDILCANCHSKEHWKEHIAD